MKSRLNAVALAALAAACGGTGTITATPAIKADVASAVSAVSSADRSLHDAYEMKNAGSAIAAAMQSGTFLDLNLSEGVLPERTALPVSDVQPDGLTSITASASGCLAPDPQRTDKAVFLAAGSGGCAAADHLEVRYANGDVVNISWSGAGSSFTLSVSVAAGDWKGTALTGAFSPAARLTGTVRLAPGADIFQSGGGIDSDLDWSYASSSSSTQVAGHATDRIASATVTAAAASNAGTLANGDTISSQSGQIAVQLGANSVGWPDFGISDQIGRDPATGFVVSRKLTVHGAVLWNGKLAGSIASSPTPAGFLTTWLDGTLDLNVAFSTVHAPPY